MFPSTPGERLFFAALLPVKLLIYLPGLLFYRFFTIRKNAQATSSVFTLVLLAHPDDETLFFWDFLRTHPGAFLAVMTNGTSPRRTREFFRAVEHYRARGRLYAHLDHPFLPLSQRTLVARIEKLLHTLRPSRVLTHNAEGEYGHPHHRQLHDALRQVLAMMPDDKRPDVYTPPSLVDLRIPEHQLPKEKRQAKRDTLQALHPSQSSILLKHERFAPYLSHEALPPLDIEGDTEDQAT